MTITGQVRDFIARLRSGVEDHEQYRETNYAHGYLDALRMTELYVTQLTAVEELTEASSAAASVGKELLANIARLREITERVAHDLDSLPGRAEEAQDRADDTAANVLVELPRRVRKEARKA